MSYLDKNDQISLDLLKLLYPGQGRGVLGTRWMSRESALECDASPSLGTVYVYFYTYSHLGANLYLDMFWIEEGNQRSRRKRHTDTGDHASVWLRFDPGDPREFGGIWGMYKSQSTSE